MKLCECGCGKDAGVYSRSQTRGDVEGAPRRFVHGHSRRESVEIRFWRYVNKQGPILVPALGACWVWTGNANRGRGTLAINQRPIQASRVAWFLETGEWPMPFACHKCDNGLCVRFSHLFEGDQEANMQDMARKERGGSTKLTAEQVKLIRTALNNGAVGAQLARDYGIAKSTVCDIKKGRSWPKEVNL